MDLLFVIFIVTFIITLPICMKFLRSIRPIFPAYVNCWFCCKNVKIDYSSRNSWECPYCEQYNGFLKNGDYNRKISAQYERPNKQVTYCSNSDFKATANILCKKCNFYQGLKVQQLASFTSSDPQSYDEEVEQYKQHLEKMYQLCADCEKSLNIIMIQKHSWVLEQRLNKLLHDSQAHTPKIAQQTSPILQLTICQLLCVLVAKWLVLATIIQKMDGHFGLPDVVTDVLFASLNVKYEMVTFTCALAMIVACLRHAISDWVTVVVWMLLHWLYGLKTVGPWCTSYFTICDLHSIHMGMLFLAIFFGLLPIFGQSRRHQKKNKVWWNNNANGQAHALYITKRCVPSSKNSHQSPKDLCESLETNPFPKFKCNVAVQVGNRKESQRTESRMYINEFEQNVHTGERINQKYGRENKEHKNELENHLSESELHVRIGRLRLQSEERNDRTNAYQQPQSYPVNYSRWSSKHLLYGSENYQFHGK